MQKTVRKLMGQGAACLLAASLAGGSAFAQSTTTQTATYGPVQNFTDGGGITTVNLTVPTNVTGNGSLDVSLLGDFGGANEALQVSVEGTVLGLAGTPGTNCTSTSTDTFTIPAATLAAAAADGTVSITFNDINNRVNIGTGGGCLTTPYSFQVNGVLTYTVPGVTPVTPTAASSEATFLGNRGATILAGTLNTPRRIERLRRGTGVTREALSFEGVALTTESPLGLEISRKGLTFATGTDTEAGAMVWAEGRITAIDDDATDDGIFAILHAGADYAVSPDMLVGFSVQFDRYSQTETATGADFSGTGWMLGPVLTTRLTDQVYLDARLAYGQADNEVDRTGGTDQFDSTRYLAEVSVTGEMAHGPYTLYPELELSYFGEESDAYTSATIGAVAAADVALGQARAGIRVERPFDLGTGEAVTAFGDFDAVYTRIYEGTAATGSFVNEIEGMSGEIALGLNYTDATGSMVGASVGAGGLFTDATSYSASVEVSIPIY